MKKPIYTNQFRRDKKLAEKRNLDITKLDAILSKIICENPLPLKNRNHILMGKWAHHLECHIEPDWLLIYFFADDEVHFVQTGTHSDLYY